jgi:FkbM family methyltransferase
MTKLSQRSALVRGYWRDTRTVADFASVMRVRLSQSKVGPLVAPKPIVVDVDLRSLGHGVRLRSHTTDISVLAEIVLGGSIGHLPADLRADTIVDLGANIGLAYRWFRARYPSARFACIEPDAGNYEVLCANVRAIDGDRTHTVRACIGGRARRVALTTSAGEWGYRMRDVDDEAQGTVDVVTLEEVLADAGIDRVGILKCDIEGAEAELFDDCASWIGRVEHLIVECHTDVITAPALMATIERNGGRFELLHLERNPGMGFEIATLRALP